MRKWLLQVFFENSHNRCLSISCDILFVTLVHSSSEPKAGGPHPSHAGESGPHSAFSSAARPWQKLPRLSTSRQRHARRRRSHWRANFLSMAFTIHDQAAQNQLTFPLGLLGGEAGVQLEWKRTGWNMSGGPAPWTMPVQEHPKPTPSSPHHSSCPDLVPIPCGGQGPTQWASLDDCLSSSPRPTCLETQ